ncbi:unnamed protein product [Fraxinus pennsylvanica]|uniref:Pentatricopeptide repeat-containing protein n=1 Tax=Fraxinus pennsylvanica TaxID=56036 RepID=A0AAD1ZVL3_9LAMI|nr:unnamed protein product [Fraxinus pennsylvanica]
MNRHARLIKLGLDTNAIHATKLVNDYSLCHAHQVFDQVSQRDTTLWTALISAYARSEPSRCSQAIRLFSIMAREQGLDTRPNHYTVTTVARAVASAPEHLYMGKALHGYVIKSGMMSRNVVVETAFMDMYAKCVANIQDLIFGLQIHGYAIVSGFDSNCLNSIAHMYFCCGQVNQAEKLFSVVEGDIASKMIKIRGYVYNQRYCEVLKQFCLDENPAEIFNWDHTIILPILTACTKLSLLRVGKQVHSIFITLFGSCFRSKFSEDDKVILGSAFIDMYSKCNIIDDAQKVFDYWMPERRVSHWNALISGRCGLVDEGLHYFELMKTKYNLMPREDHFTCLMDMLGRVGKLDEAWHLLEEIEDAELGERFPSGTILAALLGNCYVHGNVDIGKRVAKKMLQCGKQVSTTHITLSNVYSSAGLWNEAFGVRMNWKKDSDENSEPGLSRICTRPQEKQSKAICSFSNIFSFSLSYISSRLLSAHATIFTVGDSSGWDFNMGNWTDGKHFKASDVLGLWNEAFGVRMNWKKDSDENTEPGLSRICTRPQFEAARATIFTVGDFSGWDFNMGNWTDGKHFKANDVLGEDKAI